MMRESERDRLQKDTADNDDETHFKINMDNSATLGLTEDQDVSMLLFPRVVKR